MGFNNQKISFFINDLYTALTSDIKELVDKNGTDEIRFISDSNVIKDNDGEVIFKEYGTSATLREVCITETPFDNPEQLVIFLDKWEQTEKTKYLKIIFENSNMGVDGIIFHYDGTENELSVYLIEMKSTISDNTIEHCKKKFEQTISKLSLFIPVIANGNNINLADTKIFFKGVVFFSNRGSVSSANEVSGDLTDIYRAYHKVNRRCYRIGTASLKNTLFNFNSEAEKIDVRFIGYQDSTDNPIFATGTTANKIVITFANFVF
jgi:hypothetical protein